VTLWEVDIYPAPGQADAAAREIREAAAELGLAADLAIHAAHGYLVQGRLSREEIDRVVRQLLADPVVEQAVAAQVGDAVLAEPPEAGGSYTHGQLPVHVLPKPGVMDPVAQSALAAIRDFEVSAEAVRTFRKYWTAGLDDRSLQQLSQRLLANDAIEQVVIGPLKLSQLELGAPYEFELVTVPLADLDDEGLARLSREGQLYLTLVEMQTIQQHFRELGRDPTDVELETVAQTWSEHCSHKTLAGRILYRDDDGERQFENMLKETIFAATQQIRRELGDDDWCVSVFKDNAGIVRFNEDYNAVFKVETHNHPSALEPYGGANTGIGGVIRDTLGTGLGAKPVANTDVFCFAPPDTSAESLPPGLLHPKRVMKGVVAGVRDYGNRMGIPTVDGAVCFDPRYLGNPLVYCGSVGIIPTDKSHKEPQAGDLIVALGGRTGRDGIHGATFSSAELTSESESTSGGAVQIGNAITEKMVLDVVLAARDRGLFTAITDCGAGGFSSAVGEMGETLGATVDLERAPLKYEGLSYTEIWISEAQERMVLSVPEKHWPALEELAAAEGVEATVIGRFGRLDEQSRPRLVLRYEGHQVADLSMEFLHDGRPPVVREAVYEPPAERPLYKSHAGEGGSPAAAGQASPRHEPIANLEHDHTATLKAILGSLNVCSKEWVIRQYDHEVQGGSVVKPLVGAAEDGPGDAAVIRPVLGSRRGLVIGCGINPHYGELDPYHMAASAIDEAVRNCVAVGADPSRIAVLDNFCWGYTDRPETLGSLVRAALACHDLAVELGTPFISGKDSLNNEFSYQDPATRQRRTIAIPPTLLISAMGQVEDVGQCVTMDLKEPGNLLYLVGATRDELGGSHYALVRGLAGGAVPKVDAAAARSTFAAMHRAIRAGLVRACHDLSEGGLAAAAAEMAIAGNLGATLDAAQFGQDRGLSIEAELFAETNSRFMIEVPSDADVQLALADVFAEVDCTPIGAVADHGRLIIADGEQSLIEADVVELKEAWQAPLRW